ncbi:hypothetical protein ACQP3J_32320, partial [Escherichia coli]
ERKGEERQEGERKENKERTEGGKKEGMNGKCSDYFPPKCMLPFNLLMEMRHFPMDAAFPSNLLLSVI